MSKYSACFDEALLQYTGKAKRPGYVPGLFAWARHSRKLYPHIAELQSALINANSESDKKLVEDYFQSPKTKFNNHSFSLYFLEQLIKRFPEERWEIFYPKEMQVVFYTGTLYRGTLQDPADALAKGMKGDVSDKISAYANDTNMHTGLSTTKDLDVAKRYQTSTFQTARGVHFQTGFIYEINYRGTGGVDIIETLLARGHTLTASVASHKDEVNIIGVVVPEDIVGYWDKVGVYHNNPTYLPQREIESTGNLPERLEKLFIRR